jgi:hypothetical protein
VRAEDVRLGRLILSGAKQWRVYYTEAIGEEQQRVAV